MLNIAPFTEPMLESIIGHMFIDNDFFLQCVTKLKPQWFGEKSTALGIIFNQMISFNNIHNRAPLSMDELLNESFFLTHTPKEQSDFKTILNRCAMSTKMFSVDNLALKLTGYMQISMFKEAVTIASTKFNNAGFHDAYSWVKKELEKIGEVRFIGDNKVVDFSNSIDFMINTSKAESQVISTGMKLLDSALGGGLFKGETCAIMAPSNNGKSKALMTMGRHAVMNGSKVLYIPHEDSPIQIRKRILSSFIGMSVDEIEGHLKKVPYDPSSLEREIDKKPLRDKASIEAGYDYVCDMINKAEKIIAENFIMLPFIKTGEMFIEDLIIEIKHYNLEQKAKTGKGFDLIIDDYPKRLKFKKGSSKESAYRNELADMYDIFNQLAAELNVHCLVAVQTNRTGAKMNKGTLESNTYLGAEEIDESYGIVQNLGSIITINRSPQDSKAGIIHYCIAKSRNEKVDTTISTKASFARNILHGDEKMFETLGYHMHKNNTYKGFASTICDFNTRLDTGVILNILRQIERGDTTSTGLAPSKPMGGVQAEDTRTESVKKSTTTTERLDSIVSARVLEVRKLLESTYLK